MNLGINCKPYPVKSSVIVLNEDFECPLNSDDRYSVIILDLLRKIFHDSSNDQEIHEKILHATPLMTYNKNSRSLPQYSLRLLCKLRPGAGRFFYDMTSRWLIPNKKITTSLFFVSDFKFFNAHEIYTIAEIIVVLNDAEDEKLLKNNIRALKKEILVGVQSHYLASRILEIKGLTNNEKIAYVHERIAHLVRKIPSIFDYDIFAKMQHFLISSSDEFKSTHDYRHISRIIYYLYLLEKKIQGKSSIKNYRHLIVKSFSLSLKHPLGSQQALGICIALNFLKDHEVFDKRHMVKAILRTIPSLRVIEDSFFIDRRTDEKIATLYLEVQKASGREFSSKEIKEIQRQLPNQVKNCIEHLLRPVFMPRNEEEIMKNLLLLSTQVKYVKDFPQVMISFDEQTDRDLFFTVIVARVVLPTALPLQTVLAENRKIAMNFAVERVKKIGSVRKKYPKEASVMRVRLPAIPFLREDLSLDLYSARQNVVEALEELFGEIRDFNGGMIAKQRELFHRLLNSLPKHAKQDHFLLENFFHSIFPVEQRSILSEKILKKLFLMLKNLLDEYQPNELMNFSEKKEERVYVILMEFHDINLKQRVIDQVKRLNIPSRDLAVLHMQVYEAIYLGYIYFAPNTSKNRLESAIKQILDFC